MLKKDTQKSPVALLGSLLESLGPEYCFSLHTAYHVIVNEHWQIVSRRNADLHLLYVRGGEGMYWLDGVPEPLERGKVIFVSNDALHSAKPSFENSPHIIPLRFGVHHARSGRERRACLTPFSLAYAAPSPSWFEEHFIRLHDLQASMDRISLQEIHARLLLVLTRLYADLSRPATVPDARIEEVRQAIDRHPDARWQVEEMAAMAKLSHKYFLRLFAAQTGMTPRQYQIRARCERARYLLDETSMAVGEIAAALGYPDLYTFSRQFSKVTGTSPSAYRLQHRH